MLRRKAHGTGPRSSISALFDRCRLRPQFVRTIAISLVAACSLLAAGQSHAQPTANPDNYSISVNQTLSAPAGGVPAGVLDNDIAATSASTAGQAAPANGTRAITADGSLTYTPNPGFVGVDTFTYLAVGLPPFAIGTVTVTVTNDTPVANNDTYAATEDVTLNIGAGAGVLANDTDAHPLTASFAAGSGPANGALTLNADGSFSYIPNPGFSGSDTFQYRAIDNQAPPAQSALATVTINVASVNDAPIAIDDTYATDEDNLLSINISTGLLSNDSDPEGDGIQVLNPGSIGIPAAQGTLTVAANGNFTYNPAANFSGPVTFNYQAVDDGSPPAQSAPATVTITVNPVNDIPVANPDNYPVDEDTTLNVGNVLIGLLGNDTDLDGDTLQVVNPSSVEGQVPVNQGTLALNANGTFQFVPAAAFNGDVTFTYEATDSTATSNTVTVTITVQEINDPPVALADSYSVDEDGSLSINSASGVLSNDSDEENGTLTATLGTSATSGTLTLNPNGSFDYTPNADFSGSDSFTYFAVDDFAPPAQSAETTVTITVNPVNDPPIAVDDTYTTDEDTSLSEAAGQGVLANDTDADPADVLTVQLVTDVLNGTLTLDPDGSFDYTPNLDFNGDDSFVYRVSDNAAPPGGPLESGDTTVTITVTAVNDAPRPIAVDPDPAIPELAVTENVTIDPILNPELNLEQYFIDPEGDPMSFTVNSGLPDGLIQTPPSGQISGTPALGTPRTCVDNEGDVELVVSDGTDTSDPVVFCLRVIEAGRTDLTLSIGATPSPALINESVTWMFTIDNLSLENVPSAAIDARVEGQVPFTFTPQANCTILPQVGFTDIRCTGGPVSPGGSLVLQVSGSSSQAGDVAVMGTVSVDGPIPIESDITNDSAAGALGIAEQLAPVPAQSLALDDHRSAAAGDFNGDGFDDLVAATGSALSTQIFANIVDPTDPNAAKRILSPDPLTLGDQAPGLSVASGDLNGDGALDLVTANGAGQANQVFINDNAGDGSFGFSAGIENLGDPMETSNAIAIADLDGDTLADIVYANASPNPLYINQGGGVFLATADAALGDAESVDVVAADLFGSPLPEIVFANSDGDAEIYSSDGTVYSATTLATGPTTSVIAADFDGDGRVDLVFGRATVSAGLPSNLLFLNTSSGGTGQFFEADALGGAPTTDLLAFDPDADGDLDILAINETDGHQVFDNNGNGIFTLHNQQFVSVNARVAAAAQFSIDDRIDVAVIGPTGINVFYNDGSGNIGAGDTDIPVLTLTGEPELTLTVEADYEDAGATALDPIDGDITDRIVVDNPVNTAVLGTYTVTYTVTDRSGNTALPITRTVNVGARTGTGGGGGGIFSLGLALFLVTLGAARRSGRLRSYWSAR